MRAIQADRDVPVPRQHGDARETHHVAPAPAPAPAAAGGGSRGLSDARGRCRGSVLCPEEVARRGEWYRIVGKGTGVQLDRLFVAQAHAQPQAGAVVLRDADDAVYIAHPVAAGATATRN